MTCSGVHTKAACVPNLSLKRKRRWLVRWRGPHTIKGHLCCKSNYVVYVLDCPCGLQYVGRTTQKLRERVNKPRINIRHKAMHHSVSRHYHGGDPDLLYVIPLEQVKVTLSLYTQRAFMKWLRGHEGPLGDVLVSDYSCGGDGGITYVTCRLKPIPLYSFICSD